MEKEKKSNINIDLGTIINLPKFFDPRGNLTVAEQGSNIPFEIKKVSWAYNFAIVRHNILHSCKKGMTLIVPLSGSFSINLYKGDKQQSFFMNHPYQGLLIKPSVQRTIENIANGTICLFIDSQEDDHKFIKTQDFKQ